MINFVCIKWGNKYSADYVNNLYNMVSRHYTKPFTFTCFTDEHEGVGCDTMPIPDINPLHPKYWFGKENYCWDRAKFLMFNSHKWLGYEGGWCYLDLDVIIHGRINDLNELAKKPRIIYSHWQPQKLKHDRLWIDIRGTFYNSSVMCWQGKQAEHIYYDALENSDAIFKTFFKGTDNYHYWRQRDFWKDIPKEWVYSYNRGARRSDLEIHKYREDYKICLFNTDLTPGPNKHEQIDIGDLKDEKLLRHWHGPNYNR